MKKLVLLSLVLILGQVAKADAVSSLQPILQSAVCEGNEVGGDERITVVITDVMLTGFRSATNLDGTPMDIIATTIGLHRSKLNFDDSTVQPAQTNYNVNNLTDRTYVTKIGTLVVALPELQSAGNMHKYSAKLETISPKKYNLVCLSDRYL